MQAHRAVYVHVFAFCSGSVFFVCLSAHYFFPTTSCTFCEESAETLIRLFWNCKFVKTFWPNDQYWIIQPQIKPQYFSLTLSICLRLVDAVEEGDVLLHRTLLIGMYHIYPAKFNKTLSNLQFFEKRILGTNSTSGQNRS